MGEEHVGCPFDDAHMSDMSNCKMRSIDCFVLFDDAHLSKSD